MQNIEMKIIFSLPKNTKIYEINKFFEMLSQSNERRKRITRLISNSVKGVFQFSYLKLFL